MESHVLLQCIVEAFPKPLNTWYRNEGIVSAILLHLSRRAMMAAEIFLNLFQFTEMT